MNAPWKGPRYRSWASDRFISGAVLAVLMIATGVADVFGEPSTYLIGMLGTAAGTFFGALSSDKAKRDADVAQVAEQAKRKVDELETVARREHPDTYNEAVAEEDDQ